jgi:hypothetical protein
LQEENDTEHMETCDELNLEIHCDSLESDDLLISSNRGAENSTIEREHDGTLRSEMIPCLKGDQESTRHSGRTSGLCMEVGSDENRQEACESIMDISKFKKYSIDLRERIETSRITLPENLSETTPVDKAAKTIAFCLREHKQALIKEVVIVIGVPRALEILKETKIVQDNGGMETNDKSKPKRSPGGVFLRLLRDFSTKDELKRIFAKERNHSKKKIKRKKKLKHSRKGDKGILEVKCDQLESLPPKNLEKRLPIADDKRCTKDELDAAVQQREIEEGEIPDSVEWF